MRLTNPLLGVYEAGVPGSWSGLSAFASAAGIRPRIVVYYSAWYERFKTAFARTALEHGSYVFVKLQPDRVTLASIAAGGSDSYLRSYAFAVRAFGRPVIFSFAHEMNGEWYPWGAGHASPADFVRAWRHVVQVFRDAGATNVTWVWTANSVNAAQGGLSRWWPGSAWVNWVGIDGYYYRAGDTFDSVFGTTIAQIRAFSSAPVLISETAVGVTADRRKQIASLFAGAEAGHVVGVVWFDKGQHGSIFHQDWRVEKSSAALAAFATAARRYVSERLHASGA